MGATNCPETPRQRMIGMMYLVLTAMLALNVSVDILNAFGVVDETLRISNKNIEGKIATDYAALDKQKAILGEEKVKDAVERAEKLHEAANSKCFIANSCNFPVKHAATYHFENE